MSKICLEIWISNVSKFWFIQKLSTVCCHYMSTNCTQFLFKSPNTTPYRTFCTPIICFGWQESFFRRRKKILSPKTNSRWAKHPIMGRPYKKNKIKGSKTNVIIRALASYIENLTAGHLQPILLSPSSHSGHAGLATSHATNRQVHHV